MLEIRRETLDKLDEMLEHIDTAFLWVIKYVEKNHIPLDEAMSFHIKRLQILLQEINTPLTCNPIISDEKPPRDKLTVYLLQLHSSACRIARLLSKQRELI